SPLSWAAQDLAVALGAAYLSRRQPKPTKAPELHSKGNQDPAQRLRAIEKEVLGGTKVVHVRSEPQAAPSVPPQPIDQRKSSLPSAEEILDVLRRFTPAKKFHLTPDIPLGKLANAQRRCRFPPNEKPLALLDCTVFESANDSLI